VLGQTIDRPVKFNNAIISTRVIPGDVLELRGGTYSGDYVSSLFGLVDSPITIKPYNNERVIIDGSIDIGTSVTLRDLELTDSRQNRTLRTLSMTMNGAGHSLIGCVIHDMHSSSVNWFGSGVGKIIECVMYNNGYTLDGFGHGHGIYTHNTNGGSRLIARNLVSPQLGKYTLHIYSSASNYQRDYTVENNVFYGPVHTGGGRGLIDHVYRNNVHFWGWSQLGRYSLLPNINGLIENNLFIKQSSVTVNADSPDPWQNLTQQNNVVWNVPVHPGYTEEAEPASWHRWIPFTESGRWSGALVLFDRDSTGSVNVDALTGTYTVRNYQNMSQSAVLNVAGVTSVPTNIWTAADAVGVGARAASWPRFGVLVVEK